MGDFDPYKHIRDLARSIMRQERQSEPTLEQASQPGQDAPPAQEPRPGRSSRRAGTDLGPIAGTLKAARLRKGLTQRELGRLAGVPQSHVSKIEAGAVDLRFSSLVALAELLDLRFELVPSTLVPSTPVPGTAPALALVVDSSAPGEPAGASRGPAAAPPRGGNAAAECPPPADGLAQ
jgi:transcriptional regulator with XRE-family HTH domain